MSSAGDAPVSAPRTGCQGTSPAPPVGEVTIVAHDIGAVRGMERQLTELVLGLTRLGHRVTVIARTCELPEDSRVSFHRVRGPGRPFVIAYPWFLLVGSLAVRRWRRGVLQVTGAIVLNSVDVIAVHYCHQVATPTPSRSTRLFRTHVRLAGALKRIGERVCLRVNRPAAVVCVSDGVADEIREHFPALRERIVTIHNGIDTSGFAPGRHRSEAPAMRRALQIPDERLVAAFVASEWERKGLASVIHALALVEDWDLLVAGGGDEQRYRKLADSLDVGTRVHWLGITREVPVVYELSDAFVLPTSYESFSLVTFEAAASGLPIIATPVNGVRELIEDGRSGFLVVPEPSVIAERLSQLADDPSLRRRLGEAARRAALGFGVERMVAAHHALYVQLGETAST
ncbi:MAG: glycosyltransferase family 4 protein [Solirubrobacteraceae bacterium]